MFVFEDPVLGADTGRSGGLNCTIGALDVAYAAQVVNPCRHIERYPERPRKRYLLPGETQDTAIMFVPAEAIYADLHEHFPGVLQNAHRARVVHRTYPTIAWLSIRLTSTGIGPRSPGMRNIDLAKESVRYSVGTPRRIRSGSKGRAAARLKPIRVAT